MTRPLSRRGFIAAAGAATGAGLLLPKGAVWAQASKLPSSPVALNVIDAAGNLALTQKIFDNFAAARPELVSGFTFNKAPSPELPGKIKAQQRANRIDIDLVIIGPDALSAGLADDIWTDIIALPDAGLPDLQATYLEPAWRMQGLSQGKGVVISYYPSGPLIEYNPAKVATPPKTAEELLAWARENPNKLIYARPANSGPGRTFLMGLPYLLGDSNPKDPQNGWDKTWAYLKELHKYIEYYPAGTGALMKELGEGTRDMTVTTTGWDINPRALGVVPEEFKVAKLDGFHWVCDAHYFSIPKGVAEDKVAVLMEFIKFALQPEQQAYSYDSGYFYPGPAVKDVPLSMAPQESQDIIAKFGRPEYEDWIANHPIELPLEPEALVTAFRRWDEDVAAG
ncbi:extracellular solute-binding protein (plasmid) [Gemmobacter fulvus]|uniref:Extracellular solute-binding protein n=1 Tax=Gemmobacter fulvus TaxID=2840474 RepID=A0A975S3D5_9RHOB|nr:extracellular solute-binding protein [Gemmobacter fulvus]MBT9246348.1 extracellular solute-binding protein [Gemmobacter fulvus]MDQ1850305.1 extracellular solute-binding protein [Gemmobacter fulvus]QWK92301.1 extracellular solute-binding protein [Gemmobacter fulvus]